MNDIHCKGSIIDASAALMWKGQNVTSASVLQLLAFRIASHHPNTMMLSFGLFKSHHQCYQVSNLASRCRRMCRTILIAVVNQLGLQTGSYRVLQIIRWTSAGRLLLPVKAYKEMFDQTVLLSLYWRHYNRSIRRVTGMDEHLKGPIDKAKVGWFSKYFRAVPLLYR